MIFTPNTPIAQLGEEAVILIDKPLEWTSFDVVKKLKYAISNKLGVKARKFKIGHAGTLDPLATGLLVLCTGKGTKKIQTIQDAQKTYTGVITIGATTPSYDLETDINQTFDTSLVSVEQCKKVAQSFLGNYEQIPPLYSAIWVDGKRAYELARKGKEIELKSREVQIHSFKIDALYLPNVSFEVQCTKGTYIRTLAKDFGDRLNNGAYLSELRRTKIGDFDIKDAWTIDDFKKQLDNM